MATLFELSARRSEIVYKINGIRSMRKGVMNAKYQNVKHKNGEIVRKGPYYVLTKKAPGGKTVSLAIPAKDAPYIREEVDNYKMFRELADEYVDVCEKISLFQEDDSQDEVKKTEHFGRN